MNLVKTPGWWTDHRRDTLIRIWKKFPRRLTISAVIRFILFHYLLRRKRRRNLNSMSPKFCNEISQLITSQTLPNAIRLPSVFVDIDAFDQNIAFLRDQMHDHPSTTIRIASKSIRVPFLLNRILSHGLPFRGLMAFAVEEAQFLCELGFDDILIGYPSEQKIDYEILKDLHEQQKKLIRIVVDNPATIQSIDQSMAGVTQPFPLIIEFDASYRLCAGLVHFGARRSSIRSIKQLIELLELARSLRNVKVEGIMVYESHIAGIGDCNPANASLNPIIRLMKTCALPRLQCIRKEIGHVCSTYGLTLFNGGGTGSLLSTLKESSVLTEITVGSGFFQPHLFDHYEQNDKMLDKFHRTLQPSCYFVLPRVRTSDRGEWITCAGGGYVASGRPGWDKIPLPVYPVGLTVSEDEGSGEVQTPLKISSKGRQETLHRLDTHPHVFFRHAKGGELAERFHSFLCFKDATLLEAAQTYRGYGKAFF